jgi:hypothetical protein
VLLYDFKAAFADENGSVNPGMLGAGGCFDDGGVLSGVIQEATEVRKCFVGRGSDGERDTYEEVLFIKLGGLGG